MAQTESSPGGECEIENRKLKTARLGPQFQLQEPFAGFPDRGGRACRQSISHTAGFGNRLAITRTVRLARQSARVFRTDLFASIASLHPHG